jgi:hypothetical protein
MCGPGLTGAVQGRACHCEHQDSKYTTLETLQCSPSNLNTAGRIYSVQKRRSLKGLGHIQANRSEFGVFLVHVKQQFS